MKDGCCQRVLEDREDMTVSGKPVRGSAADWTRKDPYRDSISCATLPPEDYDKEYSDRDAFHG